MSINEFVFICSGLTFSEQQKFHHQSRSLGVTCKPSKKQTNVPFRENCRTDQAPKNNQPSRQCSREVNPLKLKNLSEAPTQFHNASDWYYKIKIFLCFICLFKLGSFNEISSPSTCFLLSYGRFLCSRVNLDLRYSKRDFGLFC